MMLRRLTYTLLMTGCLLQASYASDGAFTIDEYGDTTFNGKVQLMTNDSPALSVRGETQLLSNVHVNGDMDMNNHHITSLTDPFDKTDAANRNYVDTTVANAANIVGAPGQIAVTGNNPKTLSLMASGAAAGSYTNANLNVDQYGRITTVSNGSSGVNDTFQILPSSNNVTWDFLKGNFADLTLTVATTFLKISNMATAARGTLVVRQDAIGNRNLFLPVGTFRFSNNSPYAPLSIIPTAIDILNFQKGLNDIYLVSVTNQMYPVKANQKIFDAVNGSVSLIIPPSEKNICQIKLLGAGGGQGLYNGGGSSGSGGFTIYSFNTTKYWGQELKILVGSGGEGGIWGQRAGNGGYPNGGRGISGDSYPGGGGGRSEVRIGSHDQIFDNSISLAIAGAGGGGSGYTLYKGGAGGGENGQNDSNNSSIGGTQTEGGKSADGYPGNFQLAAKYKGAGALVNLAGQSYDTGGGGDGYYGGGAGGGDARPSSGGSGYSNKTFDGYLSSYTYIGNYLTRPLIVDNDPDFNDKQLGIGRLGGGQTGSGLNGGNGRIVVEFL